MFIGIAINLTARLLSSASPASLFANGEVGVWYDPSDITTLFQDSAGTIPVTAAGQSVRRMLDKSGRGNHATQAVLAQAPTYGLHPYFGVRNLLSYTEQFDNAVWAKTSMTVSVDPSTTPTGVTSGNIFTPTTTLAEHYVEAPLTPATGTFTESVFVKTNGYRYFRIRPVHIGATQGATQQAEFDLANGTVVNISPNCTANMSPVGDGWYRCSLTFTISGTLAGGFGSRLQASDNDRTNVFSGDGVSGYLVRGVQREVGTAATNYQKVVTIYEVTETGIPSVFYLAFDGVDDGMATSAINFTVTDAVTIWAGLRKQSDAARACFVELGISMATGRFNIEAPSGALNDIALFSGGTNLQAIGAVVAAPSTRVMSGQAKISTDFLKIRLNGVDAGSNSADQGTGNYSNSILYIGRRGGTTLPFNGRIYSLIIRGVESTQGQITSTESWVNSKTGAY
jgi:hypothetical protein